MSQAKARNTTLSFSDVIAPNRPRFSVISNPAPRLKSRTMQLIDVAAEQLAAASREIPQEAPLSGVTAYGRITDQPAFTAATLARIAARRKGGAL